VARATRQNNFPSVLGCKKIIFEVNDIVNSPSTKWYVQQGTGGALTKTGKVWQIGQHGKSEIGCKLGAFTSQQKEG